MHLVSLSGVSVSSKLSSKLKFRMKQEHITFSKSLFFLNMIWNYCEIISNLTSSVIHNLADPPDPRINDFFLAFYGPFSEEYVDIVPDVEGGHKIGF